MVKKTHATCRDRALGSYWLLDFWASFTRCDLALEKLIGHNTCYVGREVPHSLPIRDMALLVRMAGNFGQRVCQLLLIACLLYCFFHDVHGLRSLQIRLYLSTNLFVMIFDKMIC